MTYMPEAGGQFTPEEEIRRLEAMLEAKKQELAARGAEVPHEKSILKEVLKEHVEDIQRAATSSQPNQQKDAAGAAAALQAKKDADELREKEHKDQVDELVEIAFTRGLVDAVGVARHLNNPHILDDFHDALTDEYYEKLLATRNAK